MTNLNDSGAGSLRNAIAIAAPGDTVNFALTGTIILTSGELVVNKNLIITGPGAPSSMRVTRSTDAGTPSFRIFHIDGSGMAVNISNLTISNGRSADGGGGVYSSGNMVAVNNCVFSANVASDNGGGAILNDEGNLSVHGCVFDGNVAEDRFNSNPPPDNGGAIQNRAYDGSSYNGHATLAVYSSTFTNNRSELGGGAIGNSVFTYNSGGEGVGIPTATVDGCVFSDNSSEQSGGGIVSYNPGVLTVRLSTFSGNIVTGAGSNGGGLAAYNNLTVESCAFEDNECTGNGGGVYNSGPNTVTGSLFNGNKARGGAGLYSGGGLVSLVNCTLTANIAGADGGGGVMSSGGSTLTISHCTFSGNIATASNGRAIQLATSGSATVGNSILAGDLPAIASKGGSIASEGYNLCTDNGAGLLTGPGDQINTQPKLDGAGLQHNGGPTRTLAVTGDSPALDKGKSSNFVPVDQRGQFRPVVHFGIPTAPGGDGSDIGAFEATDPVQTGPSIVVTTLSDHDDGIAGVFNCSLREAIRRANQLPGLNTIVFAPHVTGTITLDRNLGSLVISESVTIVGPGARLLAVSGGGYIRPFHFTGGTSNILGLTIRDGRVGSGALGLKEGGGILNQGTLTLTSCALVYNVASGDAGNFPGGHGGAARGGAISSTGPLTLVRCALNGNRAFGGIGADTNSGFLTYGGHGGSGHGGAIYSTQAFEARNCTFFDNGTSGGRGGSGGHFGGAGANGDGGAVFGSGVLTLTSCTVSGNYGFGGAAGLGNSLENSGPAGIGRGGISVTGNNNPVKNTIIAGNIRNPNLVSDAVGIFASGGFNLIGGADGASGFTATGDQTGTNAAPLDPKLGSFGNHGGSTDSRPLLTGSPALDQGNNFGLFIDQRGFLRPLDIPQIGNAPGGDGSDIGAVEEDLDQVGPVFYVTTSHDHDDGHPSFNDTSLREAIIAANNTEGANTIRFMPGVTGVFELTEGELIVSDHLTIEGPGPELAILDREYAGRVLRVQSQGLNVNLSGLTFTRGQVTGGNAGGAIYNLGDLTLDNCVVSDSRAIGAGANGGGIRNDGSLTLNDCTISGNAVVGSHNGFVATLAEGGGIFNFGSVTLNRCLMVSNTATGANSGDGQGVGGEAHGGGICNYSGLTLINTTLSGNTAAGGAGAPHFSGLGDGSPGGRSKGGGIYNGGYMSLTACTIADNSANGGPGGSGLPFGPPGFGQGGGVFDDPDGFNSLRNSICARNVANGSSPDIFGDCISGGYNLIGNNSGSTGITSVGDQSGTAATPLDPLLGTLQHNGGPTLTISLLPGSPAHDRGSSFSLTTDQRGFRRPHDTPAVTNAADGTDIGAFEVQPPDPYFISIARIDGATHLLLQGEFGGNYQLQKSDVVIDSFSNLGPPKPADASGQVPFIDSEPLQPKRFYRGFRSP